MSDSNSRPVYSSDDEGLRPRRASSPRRARRPGVDRLPFDPGDGFVRLHRGKSTGGGKAGTLVVGLPGSDSELDAILKRCKQRIGAGGTRQGRVLLIQGDHRDTLRSLLEAEGFDVKLAGG